MSSAAESLRRTEERFDKSNNLNKREFCLTALGQKAAEPFLLALRASFADETLQKCNPPPAWLAPLVAALTPEDLALIALPPLLDGIACGWTGKRWSDKKTKPNRFKKPATMLPRLRMGKHLSERLALQKNYDLAFDKALIFGERDDLVAIERAKETGKGVWRYLKSDLTDKECFIAGHWLMMWCSTTLNCFTDDDPPEIKPECQISVDQLREHMMQLDPVYMPHLTPPPDWTGSRIQYDDRLGANFVRDWRPEAKAAIDAAFEDPEFEHAKGVNALRRVALKIDQRMLALVERFAVDVMDHLDDPKQLKADKRLVEADLRDAKWIGKRPFYLDYTCDKRGRIYALQHLNYSREDHVRSLFRFANGMPLAGSIEWLEIHCANCEGSTDKDPWRVRHKWVADNRPKIQKIAADPGGTFDLWRKGKVAKPFAFVAACIELAAAWKDPNFVTHLPIGFDGSCNGVQHLSLMCRDADAGKLVNLTNSEEMYDIYGKIVNWVRTDLELERDEWAVWWCGEFAKLDNNPRAVRDLIKTPAMTFAYSSTNKGMADQIVEVYRDIKVLQRLDPRDLERAALYLAKRIREGCKELLPEPAKVMQYIRSLARHCTQQGRFLVWTTPTGFPVLNAYNEPDKKTVNVLRMDGSRLRADIAVGTLPEIRKTKVLNTAAPNFTHSLDASHLIRTVNVAVSEGIKDVATVHNSFACLAPQATLFNKVIRQELGLMYKCYDALGRLRAQNGWRYFPMFLAVNDFPEPPAYGELDPLSIWQAEFPFT